MTRKGKAGGVDVVAIHLQAKHSPHQVRGFLLLSQLLRKQEADRIVGWNWGVSL